MSALALRAYLGVASRIQVMTRAFAARRAVARARLDGEPDVVVSDGKVGFRHTFETVKDSETFCYAPEDVVDAGRRLLPIDAADGIPAAVHDTVIVRVGCNCVPVFAAVNGGRVWASSRSNVSIPTAPRSSTFGFFNTLTSSSGSSRRSRTPTTSPRSLRVSLATRSQTKPWRRSGTWFSRTTRVPKSA